MLIDSSGNHALSGELVSGTFQRQANRLGFEVKVNGKVAEFGADADFPGYPAFFEWSLRVDEQGRLWVDFTEQTGGLATSTTTKGSVAIGEANTEGKGTATGGETWDAPRAAGLITNNPAQVSYVAILPTARSGGVKIGNAIILGTFGGSLERKKEER